MVGICGIILILMKEDCYKNIRLYCVVQRNLFLGLCYVIVNCSTCIFTVYSLYTCSCVGFSLIALLYTIPTLMSSYV